MLLMGGAKSLSLSFESEQMRQLGVRVQGVARCVQIFDFCHMHDGRATRPVGGDDRHMDHLL